MIGKTELFLIIAVIVLLFGAAAIPKLAKSMGKAKSEFQRGMKEGQGERDKDDETKKIEKK